jgi:hypothetical protein
MEKDYSFKITATIPPEEAAERIGDVPAWWTKGFTGQARRRGDKFKTAFGDTYVAF